VKFKPDPTPKQKYDLPGLVDPAALPKDKSLKWSERDVNLPRKDVQPPKIRRLI
jgi:hypothetical protein